MADYKGKKVVIIGMGLTGLSCVDFFLAKGVIPRIMDTRMSPPGLKKLPKNIEFYCGGINRRWLLTSDLVIVSPGIALIDPIFQEINQSGIELIGDIELFCREVNAPIVAITGSNGKSTVTMLLSEMARAANWSVSVGGNIGLPILKLLEFNSVSNLYVLELSSFQLQTTYSLKPMVATILNIQEDHMDRYSQDLQQYRSAKLRIYKHAEVCIFNANDNMTIPTNSINKSYISFGINTGDYCLTQQGENIWLQIKGKKVINTKKLKLIGYHNYVNALAALALADAASIPRTFSLSALANFSGLPHRFQLVHQANGVRWINDSKATNVSSTHAALKALRIKKGVLWLLLGGEGKGTDFKSLKEYLQVEYLRLFCFGIDGHILAQLRPEITTLTETLQQAMEQVALQVKSGDIVLLSPACASFDQFQNFEQRGDIFTKLAKELG
ncbi:UDP-N-acetylmuramoyl-L-alanine--D-glutamate ligase [Candidatus Pantoea carbekii]|uniref:UDP-N-acetylmuramoylalanine--D-glutamate ligase n=1 Tax=Candidatus Pantoea carbekii TaxID=1235990 RepID=U3U9F3_9GAMM|nr:UDP-N-acetylmuramoyl-L-alanine--D-glutamate ligase [Candidatus Pantoea carbekii]AKC31931.1 UDP-N-acetylmuramoylalanine--D-glutamate ligase MurD [Candidatus Pantoea carbekii]BAO00448.1 MurD protein [Candidatus Pantoea carbekii]